VIADMKEISFYYDGFVKWGERVLRIFMGYFLYDI